ncbi:hypothetical protein NONO_c37450 [Nocardia nova SH22a]|uniref:Uncharacterized protein n=1 Tax=Nocardia nova SH22a TaxID=1415166 RepID=W5TH61_9NOCA|nr:hypothetical protein [Nocardia nova]AHH18532.1 hypothetical protein NONO_c37450 [Nocardia nova SH22a]
MARALTTALTTGIGAGSIIGFVLPLALWPGEARLTAPLFCTPSHHEPIVVSDTFHDSDGTSVNFTLYCVGDHGTFTDEGFLRPFLVMFAAHILIITAVVFIAIVLTRATAPDTPASATGATEL